MGWISTVATCALLRHTDIVSSSSVVVAPSRYQVVLVQPASSGSAMTSKAITGFIAVVLSFQRCRAGHRHVDEDVAIEVQAPSQRIGPHLLGALVDRRPERPGRRAHR